MNVGSLVSRLLMRRKRRMERGCLRMGWMGKDGEIVLRGYRGTEGYVLGGERLHVESHGWWVVSGERKRGLRDNYKERLDDRQRT